MRARCKPQSRILLTGEAAATKSLKVLVAEDNGVNQKLATAILRRAGHVVTVVSNGREAVAAVEREWFDAILMDVQMPVMGGFEATRLIREMEAVSGRRTPIIAVTARAMKGDREACLEAGMNAFVPKPIQSAKLLEALHDLGAAPLAARKSDLPADVHGDEIESDDILDEKGLMTLVSGDRQLAGELAELYLDDLEPRVAEIAAAVQARDGGRLWAAAHSLRGSSGSLKAESVFAATGALEAIGRSGKMAGVQQALNVLETALAGLRPRLVALAGRA